MKTIPDRVLCVVVQYYEGETKKAAEKLLDHEGSAGQESSLSEQEKLIAQEVIRNPKGLTPLDVTYLVQVAQGGPWGGDWVTTHHVASLLDISQVQVRNLINRNYLEGEKVGKKWYIRRQSFDEYQQWILTSEAAQILGLESEDIRKMIRSGELVGIQKGTNTWFVRKGDVEQRRKQ